MNKAKIYPWIFVMIFVLIIFVLSGVVSGEEFLWKYDTGEFVESVAISSDGSYIAAGDDDTWGGGAVYIFNRSGNLLWTYNTGSIAAVDMNSDGSYIVAATSFRSLSEYLYLFDKNGHLLWKKAGCWRDTSISPDGNYIVAVAESADKESGVYLFDKGGSLLWEKSLDVLSAAMGNHTVVIGGKKGLSFLDVNGVTLWDYEAKDIESVAISSDENYIVAGGEDTIYFFDKNGNLLWHYDKLDSVTAVAINSDGSCIISGSGDGWSARYIHLFDKEGNRLWGYEAYGIDVAISSDGRYIVVGYPIRLFNNIVVFTKEKIDKTLKVVKEEKSKGFVSTEAENLLSQAENAFSSKNYVKAKELTDKSYSLAMDIDQDGVTNEEDFAPTIKNIYIYTGTPIALFVLAALTKFSLDVRKRGKIKRLEKQRIRREEERRRLEYEQKIRGYKSKVEQWEREGYDVSKLKKRWFK